MFLLLLYYLHSVRASFIDRGIKKSFSELAKINTSVIMTFILVLPTWTPALYVNTMLICLGNFHYHVLVKS